MEDFRELAPQDRNLARRAFLQPEPALYGVSDPAEFRHHVVMQLRSTLARYPADPTVSGLVEELRDGSPDFARLWERHDGQAPKVLTKTFQHPLRRLRLARAHGPRPAPRVLQRRPVPATPRHEPCAWPSSRGHLSPRPSQIRTVAVGTALAGGPPRRSQRALLTHW
ncbi:MAG: hypothetical protein ABIQ18_17195, partial [Umezawaea sp.]